jgi:hypothetical protein
MEKYLGMKFDEVVEMLSQLKGLVDADAEMVRYTPSPYGWASDDTYEFSFENGVCVGVEVDPYEED